PEHDTDPVDAFFRSGGEDMICVHVNSEDNPFLPETLRKERERDRLRMPPEKYNHIWNGAYNLRSDAVVFNFKVDVLEVNDTWTRLQGLDWGFSQDPTAAVCIFVSDDVIYVRHEAGKTGLELDDT